MYFVEEEIYVPASSTQMAAQIAERIRRDIVDHPFFADEASLESSNWEIVQVDGSWCATKRMRTYNGIIGGLFVELDHLLQELTDMTGVSCEYILKNPDGSLHHSTIDITERYEFYGKGNMQKLKAGNEEFYVFPAAVSYLDQEIEILIHKSSMATDMSLMYLYLVTFLVLLIFFVTLILLIFKQMLLNPFRQLKNVNQQVHTEETALTITIPKTYCREINDSIEALEYMYNKSIVSQHEYILERNERIKLEMSKLKSQISPHFLINCLFVLQNLSESGHGDSEIFNGLIQTLSEHLRYSLSDRVLVDLKEELYYVGNYVRFTQMHYPFSITCESSGDDTILDAQVPILLLLMLTENTVKYNVQIEKKVKIEISYRRYQKGETSWICLIHRDTGYGFPEEVLERYNAFDEWEQTDGSHIGLYNVIKRLKFLASDAQVLLYNAQGAVVEFHMPYVKAEIKCDDESVGGR